MSNRELSLANALAHGDEFGATLSFHCENCGYSVFHLIHFDEKKGTRNEDVIIERTFYLKCLRCGSEEADRVLTIVPSWSAPFIDRDKLTDWRDE
jgi:hypothetical protein